MDLEREKLDIARQDSENKLKIARENKNKYDKGASGTNKKK